MQQKDLVHCFMKYIKMFKDNNDCIHKVFYIFPQWKRTINCYTEYNCRDYRMLIYFLRSRHLGIKTDMTIAVKLMYIPNNDTQNYIFCILQLVVETFEHST